MQTRDVSIPSGDVLLQGMLAMPEKSRAVVAFAHGSGSSRFSHRNQEVAAVLRQAGLATLLFDLLTADENDQDVETGLYRFDIPLLARRLTDAIDWLAALPATAAFDVGLFGASTGAAAALIAAAARPARVRAVVSRGGRPDLADDALPRVRAPALLIVGALDRQVIELNEAAALRLACEHQMILVPAATHLFEEPGTLEEVARLAAAWFSIHLPQQASP
ncbi:dienelactone hydrolase family protein [Paraburkholderia aromaticivorans]|uniref:Hydrolase n=1 Tax=Paraburkholderia aromaticivorans TaxID=2026199 RepID=A0A248VPI0_9BURK|nr:dienelactone hydrolase family protein [Paraburkholderia aromaticivorans]ASW00412.1 hydrolase [Paraburkholderia aromaticivorans]